MFKCSLKLAALCFAVLLALVSISASHSAIHLREELDKDWQRELVSFEVQADEGEVFHAGEAVGLEGEEGVLAGQLSEVERWEDGSIKAAQVWFITELGARQERTWEILWGDENAVPATDLEVTVSGGEVELRSGHFGVTFLRGKRQYAEPVGAEDVPGPVRGMRLADGTEFGGSGLYGDALIKGYSARLVAEGPVFAEMRFQYDYADGNSLELVAQFAAGGSAVLWDSNVAIHNPGSGVRIFLSDGLPELLFPVRIEHFSERDCVSRGERDVGDLCVLSLEGHEPGLITNLEPWRTWFNDYAQGRFELWVPDKDAALVIGRRNAGAWVEPGGRRRTKLMPLRKMRGGQVAFEINLAAGEAGGVRRWFLGAGRLHPEVAGAEDVFAMDDAGILTCGAVRRGRHAYAASGQGPSDCPRIGRGLDMLKDYVLDWERPEGLRHPYLFVNREELEEFWGAEKAAEDVIEAARRETGPVPPGGVGPVLAGYLVSGDPEIVRGGQLPKRLEQHLGLLGEFDTMRYTVGLIALYDALIDSEFISDEDRPYLRARMAYLAYHIHDPAVWCVERIGYRSGNPNMSYSYMMSRGLMGALLRGHPLADEWGNTAVRWLEAELMDEIGPKGETRESHHYVHVSFGDAMPFVVAAHRAGLHDFFAEGGLRKVFHYISSMVYTPPDIQREGQRVTAPMGRRPSGHPFGITGLVARATAESDPEFSKAMQFIWKQTGFNRLMGGSWGGFEHVYPNVGLPSANPEWESERFPWWGAVLRDGFGTEHEHYVNVLLPGGPTFRFTSAQGSVVKYFSMGVPIGGTFAGASGPGFRPQDAPRQELMQNRVTLARDWEDVDDWYRGFGRETTLEEETFSAMPRLDYLRADMRLGEHQELWPHVRPKELPADIPQWPSVERRGEPPVNWQRQLMFVKAEEPSEPGYLVFRDTVHEDEPTMWQFWTLSEKVGTPQEASDLEAFLTDAPGYEPRPHRSLEGDRFTAVGQFGVDVEYYIAAPSGTPRHTLRWGCRTPIDRDYYWRWQAPCVDEYQDLLLVRREGAGDYFIVLYPRQREDDAPDFSTGGGEKIIRVEGTFGTDYAFLCESGSHAEFGDASFEGTAGSVQDRQSGLVLSLGAAGRVEYGDYTMEADGSASVRLQFDGGPLVELPAEHEGTSVRLGLPYRYRPAEQTPREVEFEFADGKHVLAIPAGIRQVVLRRE